MVQAHTVKQRIIATMQPILLEGAIGRHIKGQRRGLLGWRHLVIGLIGGIRWVRTPATATLAHRARFFSLS